VAGRETTPFEPTKTIFSEEMVTGEWAGILSFFQGPQHAR